MSGPAGNQEVTQPVPPRTPPEPGQLQLPASLLPNAVPQAVPGRVLPPEHLAHVPTGEQPVPPRTPPTVPVPVEAATEAPPEFGVLAPQVAPEQIAAPVPSPPGTGAGVSPMMPEDMSGLDQGVQVTESRVWATAEAPPAMDPALNARLASIEQALARIDDNTRETRSLMETAYAGLVTMGDQFGALMQGGGGGIIGKMLGLGKPDKGDPSA